MGKIPEYKEEKDWPLEQYFRSQLKGEEARQRWLWKDAYFPEIGWLLILAQFVLRWVTYPLRYVFRLQRKQRKLREFRTFIRGDESRH